MKPIQTAYVKIWDDIVGAVTWLDQYGHAAFEFEPKFLEKGLDLAPIHLSLDRARRGVVFEFPQIDEMTFHHLPGLLASSLPDQFGNTIIDAWLVRNGRGDQSLNAVEKLCYIGKRGMGALEYSPVISSKELDKSVSIDIEQMMGLVQEILDERSNLDTQLGPGDTENVEAMLDILRIGTSVGGAVPKAIIAINKDMHVISGQSDVPEGYEHWILKFDGVSQTDPSKFSQSFGNCRVEYAYSLMVKAAGMQMTDCKLFEENGRAHFLTKRFDRIGNHKIHVLSLACMGHLGWNPVGQVNYEDAFQVMRTLKLPYPEIEEQYRRMVFNAIARNLDDHTKNISYIMGQDGGWHLSPFYDVTFSYQADDILNSRHKMKINGKQSGFTKKDFMDVAHNMEINKPALIVDQIIDTVSQWPKFADQAKVDSELVKYIESHMLSFQNL